MKNGVFQENAYNVFAKRQPVRSGLNMLHEQTHNTKYSYE